MYGQPNMLTQKWGKGVRGGGGGFYTSRFPTVRSWGGGGHGNSSILGSIPNIPPNFYGPEAYLMYLLNCSVRLVWGAVRYEFITYRSPLPRPRSTELNACASEGKEWPTLLSLPNKFTKQL